MLEENYLFDDFIRDPTLLHNELRSYDEKFLEFSTTCPEIIEIDDTENQKNPNSFCETEPTSNMSDNFARDDIDNLLTFFGLDQEFQINPPTTRALSNFQAQPECIEIEDSSDESQHLREAQDSEGNKETTTPHPTKLSLKETEVSERQDQLIHGNSNQSFDQNSSDNSEKSKKNLPHLKMDRRRKGERNHLQKEIHGYWTNNLLRWAKKYHLDWIKENLGQKFLKDHPTVNKVFNKICDKTGKKMEGINMGDYVTIYEEQDLEKFWEKFFSKKVLYRELMLSKTDAKLKMVYVKFMSNFERAFKLKKFQFLSKTEDERQNI